MLVSVVIGNKQYQREVTVKVKKDDRGFCWGKVGKYGFIWRPAKYDLPQLSITKQQKRDLCGNCNSAEAEFIIRQTRKLIKTFLLAYKEELKRLKANDRTVEEEAPVTEEAIKTNDNPLGFTAIGDDIVFKFD